ncbi:MAG: phosphotransferase [Actinomycetota bacterium]
MPDDDETTVRSSVIAAATAAGYEVTELELLRVGNNYVFADQDQANVYRVPIRPVEASLLRAENERMITLAAKGAPILAPRQGDPLHLEGGQLVTVWPLGESPQSDPSESLAPVLAQLHEVATIEGLPVWAGFGRGSYRIGVARTSGVPTDMVDEVAGRLDELEQTFPAWPKDILVHGDPHLGNLVRVGTQYLLIDLDDLAIGCREVDLAPMYTAYHRLPNVAGSWEAFYGAYGHDVDLDLLQIFVQLRQLTMVAWLFTLWDHRPESRQEAIHRVATLDEPAQWNPL